MFSQASVILFTISLMATRSLLILVTGRSVCILPECYLVLYLFQIFSSYFFVDRYNVQEMKLQWASTKEVEVSEEIPLAKFKLNKISTGYCRKTFDTGQNQKFV